MPEECCSVPAVACSAFSNKVVLITYCLSGSRCPFHGMACLQPTRSHLSRHASSSLLQDWLTGTIKFSRCLYAMLAQQRFAAPKGFPMPMPTSPDFAAAELGMKLTCGFEMVAAAAAGATGELGCVPRLGAQCSLLPLTPLHAFVRLAPASSCLKCRRLGRESASSAL